MALIICTECGKEISDKQDRCIHCGNPLRPTIESKVMVFGIIQTLDVFFNETLMGEVKKSHVLEFPISKDGVVSVSYGMKGKTGLVEVKYGYITRIRYDYNGYSGNLVPHVDAVESVK
jgi:hypothetical protein